MRSTFMNHCLEHSFVEDGTQERKWESKYTVHGSSTVHAKTVEWVGIRDIEERCCKDVQELPGIMADIGQPASCMITHPDFELVVTNDTVHIVTVASFNRNKKAVINDMLGHKRKRYIAYWNVARWIYRRLGRGNRVPLPACVVDRIRWLHPPPLVAAEAYSTVNYPEFVGSQEAPVEKIDGSGWHSKERRRITICLVPPNS